MKLNCLPTTSTANEFSGAGEVIENQLRKPNTTKIIKTKAGIEVQSISNLLLCE